MKLRNKPCAQHRQAVWRKHERRHQLDYSIFYIVVDETENAHKNEKHRQDIQQHGGNMQGQRAEPDQKREDKHDRSQQDFQNELHIFINSFAYILQFNRNEGKDVTIFAPHSPVAAPSSDAIDLDACDNVHIIGCHISVNDDIIAIKGGKGPWADTDPDNGVNNNILVEKCWFGKGPGQGTLHKVAASNTDIVFSRPNYCKIDLMVENQRGDNLFMQENELDMLKDCLKKHGVKDGLQGLLDISAAAGKRYGITVKPTCDAKYLEVGISSKSDNVDRILEHLQSAYGICPEECSFWGDEYVGIEEGIYGSDSFMKTEKTEGGDFFDVSEVPGKRPEGVTRLGGGVERFLGFLREQAKMK